jgi:two-component sensor histidine kinase
MAIHELTTNAAKHGAFSTSEGRVEVRWNVAERPTGPVLNLTWRETGGPPVRKPERQGFGSRLLQRLLAAQLQAHVEMAYDEAGIRCVIEMPVPTDTALLNPLS